MNIYKKILLCTSLVCVLCFFTEKTQAAIDTYCPVIDSSSVIDKKKVIDILTKDGFTVGPKSQDVVKAIKQFQKKYNLPTVGTIGPKTRLKLSEIASKQCSLSVVKVDNTTTPTSTVSAIIPDIDPPKIEIINPKGGETIEQGYGRELIVLWTSKNMSANDDLIIELVGENMELVAKTWKVKNTGRFVLDFNEIDDMPVGWFYLRIKYMCNSESIPCVEHMTESTFVVYPPTGYFANFFHFNNFKSGEKYDVTGSRPVTVQWYPYTKDFDYYRLYLGNVVLGTETLVLDTQSTGQAIGKADVKKLKKDMKKTEQEIQNAYYVKVQVMKRSRNNSQDIVLKEIKTAQFGIR